MQNKLIAIAACDPLGVMGKGGELPWHYPEDLDHFHRTTQGHAIIMGYRTFITLPERVFQNRICYVLTKNHSINHPLAIAIDGIDRLNPTLSTCDGHFSERRASARTPENRPWQTGRVRLKRCVKRFVIGGGEVFRLCFHQGLISEAIITHIRHTYSGDVFFPLQYIANWPCRIIHECDAFKIVNYRSPTVV
jgi:dihydrofolate reductase